MWAMYRDSHQYSDHQTTRITICWGPIWSFHSASCSWCVPAFEPWRAMPWLMGCGQDCAAQNLGYQSHCLAPSTHRQVPAVPVFFSYSVGLRARAARGAELKVPGTWIWTMPRSDLSMILWQNLVRSRKIHWLSVFSNGWKPCQSKNCSLLGIKVWSEVEEIVGKLWHSIWSVKVQCKHGQHGAKKA